MKKFSENSAIVTVLSKNNGLYSGIAKSVFSPRNSATYQIGNIIQASWKARLSDHLGFFTCELLNSIAAFAMFSQIKLLAINSTSQILLACLAERLEELDVYNAFEKLLLSIKDDDNWLFYYLNLELLLISELGFGLDLTKCVVTDSKDNLMYISPKSGKAVSGTAGNIYKNKLLPLPQILLTNHYQNDQDIKDALLVTGYFLEKALYSLNEKKLPTVRDDFIKKLV